jgi:hypothetical protein
MAPNEAAMEQPITYQGADLQASVKLNVKAVPVE